MTQRPPFPDDPQLPSLTPRNGVLWVVRWHRTDGRDTKHRYFRRRDDANRYAQRLHNYGKRVAVFRTEVTWTPA